MAADRRKAGERQPIVAKLLVDFAHREPGRPAAEPRAQRLAAEIAFRIVRSFL